MSKGLGGIAYESSRFSGEIYNWVSTNIRIENEFVFQIFYVLRIILNVF